MHLTLCIKAFVSPCVHDHASHMYIVYMIIVNTYLYKNLILAVLNWLIINYLLSIKCPAVGA